jgi:AmmeMemoRadiSam system protein B
MLKIDHIDPGSKADVQRFIKIPYRLYEKHPQWVPPFTSDTKLQMDKQKHPFYEHSFADFFIASRDGRDIGRIAALENTRFNSYHNTRKATFYLFECEDDQEAADALFERVFEWARERKLDTVVVMGPSHRAWVGDYAASAEEAYETPLGLVPLDAAFLDELAGRVSLRRIQGDAEHSLEIQLPFLQRQLGGFRLVPIMMSTDDPAAAQRLASALVEVIRRRRSASQRTLLVASSDLHHIENYDQVVLHDRAVVEAVAAFDLPTLTSVLMAPHCSVCGRMPILTMLHAARALGADAVKVLHHTNSGDVTGQRWAGQYTVGYMAAAVYRSNPDSAAQE